MFVISHVFFFVKIWSSFCQRSSQLVFASCMLVVCIYFWGVVSRFLLFLRFLWINWFRRKSHEVRHLLLPVLWPCSASHETVFWRPQLIRFCSTVDLKRNVGWFGGKPGETKHQHFLVRQKCNKLSEMGWTIDWLYTNLRNAQSKCIFTINLGALQESSAKFLNGLSPTKLYYTTFYGKARPKKSALFPSASDVTWFGLDSAETPQVSRFNQS